MQPVLGILVLGLLVPIFADAQSPALAPGARVRVTSPHDGLKKHVTTVLELRGDSMAVSGRSGSRVIALDNVTALEVSAGTRNQVVRDGLLGLGVGALLGTALMSSAREDCTPDNFDCFGPGTDEQWIAGGAAVFGAAGLITGAIIGAFHRTDRWERQHTVRAVITPAATGGMRLGISSRF